MFDVGLPIVKFLNLFFVNVKTGCFKTFFWKPDGQGKTNVSETEDGDGGIAMLDSWF